MTDKEKLDAIRAEIHRLIEVRGYDRSMANDLLTFMDSLPNEPVSEDLEEAISQSFIYHENRGDDFRSDKQIETAYRSGFQTGAKWQKLQDMGITNKAQDVVANLLSSADNPLDAYATEVAFIMLPATLKESYHHTNRDRIGDAVKLGAKWQKEKDDEEKVLTYKHGFNDCKEHINEALLSEVLPCFMHGGEADEVVAKLDEVLNQKK